MDENIPVEENQENNLSKIEKELIEIDPEVFEGITKEKKQQIIKSLVVTMH